MLSPEVEETDVNQAKKSLESVHLNNHQRKKLEREEVDEKARTMLTNKLTARPFLRRCPLHKLEMIQETLSLVLEEKRQEEEERIVREEAKKETLEQIANIMIQSDIFLEDLESYSKSKKRRMVKEISENGDPVMRNGKHHPNIMKYKCFMFGKNHYWNGKGIIPKVFKCFLAKGNPIESIQLESKDFFIYSGKTNNNTIPDEFSESAKKLLIEFDEKGIQQCYRHPESVKNADRLPVRDTLE